MTSSGRHPERSLLPVLIGVGLYLAGFLLFYPDVPTVHDEANYLEPAVAFARGAGCLDTRDPFSGEPLCVKRSYYLPGTAALMAPFVALFGWRGAYLVPALCLALTVLVTARWLQQSGRSPLFALLVLGFPPGLVFGRVAMSDLPSAALVATGLWLFFRGARAGTPVPWLTSGLLAGASAALRETNALLFIPLYLGALLRRERGVWLLVAGGLAGLTLRSLGCWLFFGDPFYRLPLSLGFTPGRA